MQIAKELRALREAAGVSRNALASHLGVTGQTILNWEKGDFIPRVDQWRALEKFLEAKAAKRSKT